MKKTNTKEKTKSSAEIIVGAEKHLRLEETRDRTKLWKRLKCFKTFFVKKSKTHNFLSQILFSLVIAAVVLCRMSAAQLLSLKWVTHRYLQHCTSSNACCSHGCIETIYQNLDASPPPLSEIHAYKNPHAQKQVKIMRSSLYTDTTNIWFQLFH